VLSSNAYSDLHFYLPFEISCHTGMYRPKFILILSLIVLVNCPISGGIKTFINDSVQRQSLLSRDQKHRVKLKDLNVLKQGFFIHII